MIRNAKPGKGGSAAAADDVRLDLFNRQVEAKRRLCRLDLADRGIALPRLLYRAAQTAVELLPPPKIEQLWMSTDDE